MRTLIALAAFSLVGPACTKSDKNDERKNAPRTATPRKAALGSAAVKRVETPPFHLLKAELIEPGKAPHLERRYNVESGFAKRAMSTATTRTENDGQPMVMQTGFAIAARGPSTMSVVALPPTAAKTSRDHPGAASYAARLEGTRATLAVTSRGILDKVSGDAPLDRKRELVASVLRHLVPLPAEAIGLGARWRVRYAVARGGTFIAQTSTYELKKAETADGLTLLTIAVDTVESAEPQPILEGERVVGDLIALKGRTRGTLIVDPSSPIASGDLKSETTFHARTKTGDEIFREATTTFALASEVPTAKK